MGSIIKELELNGWEVKPSNQWELDISKGHLMFMGSAASVLMLAKKMNQHNWIALEE
tara:strand:- start:292 stop:462 length:171 start_codon:yes stop_codon:yes gene_type:complete